MDMAIKLVLAICLFCTVAEGSSDDENTTTTITLDDTEITLQENGDWTAGEINEEPVSLFEDSSGNKYGTIGDKQIHCFTDSSGNTRCN